MKRPQIHNTVTINFDEKLTMRQGSLMPLHKILIRNCFASSNSHWFISHLWQFPNFRFPSKVLHLLFPLILLEGVSNLHEQAH